MRILLVEDEAGQADGFLTVFREAGHVVDHAATTDKALKLIRTNKYDAAAVDLCLAAGVGDVVAVEAAKSGARTVLMSASGLEILNDERDAIEMIGVPLAGAVQKPLPAHDLLKVLEGR